MLKNIAQQVLHVWKQVLHNFLMHMHAVNHLHEDIEIKSENLDLYRKMAYCLALKNV